jgi:hypothetical protein
MHPRWLELEENTVVHLTVDRNWRWVLQEASPVAAFLCSSCPTLESVHFLLMMWLWREWTWQISGQSLVLVEESWPLSESAFRIQNISNGELTYSAPGLVVVQTAGRIPQVFFGESNHYWMKHGIFRGRDSIWYHNRANVSKCTVCIPPRGNSCINCGLWEIVTWQSM